MANCRNWFSDKVKTKNGEGKEAEPEEEKSEEESKSKVEKGLDAEIVGTGTILSVNLW